MIFWRRAAELKRRANFLASQSFIVLAIQVPKDNEKTAASAEQFFATIHGIYRDDPVIQEHVSLEIVAKKDSITFYLFTPIHLKEFIEGQLYAQYPELHITAVPDYSREVDLAGMHVATARAKLTREDVYPIKTYTTSELDPLASLMAVMSNLDEGEQLWLQIVVRPVGDRWQDKGVVHVQKMRLGQHSGAAGGIARVGRIASLVMREAAQPGYTSGTNVGHTIPELSAPEQAAIKAIETKITKLGYETIFRIVSISPEETIAKARTLALFGALKQYNTTNLNGFSVGEIKIDDYNSWEQYLNREFEEKGSILNIEELASIFHFPNISVEANAISRSGSKKSEAPANLPLRDLVDPLDLTVLGKTDFRNKSQEFGIKLDDRKRHVYIIGKSGTGKSTLLENMVIDDVNEGRGVIVVDPHGEFADKVIDSVPESRINDVIVFDPSDREFPIAFNLLEQVGDDFKGMVASGFVGIFKKLFGYSWGPRLEYILRNTVLALLDSPNSTMLGIPRMLTERAFTDKIVESVKDPVIRDFWVNEWGSMDQKQRVEAMGPILNKVGQFLSTSTIRNIVGQPKSTIDIRQIMDEKKILVVNLSKGKIGEDNMALLGSMVVTKVQLAAMSRSNVPMSERPDCFLYVDEFQNFATESFATILSEARKYNLALTMAHQYIAQLSEEVRDAVIGNVGSMVLFRVGAPDAESLQKEFSPIFDVADMVNLERAHVYIKLLIDGLAGQPFSAYTLPPKVITSSFREQVVASSRARYAHTREEVEQLIDETAGYRQKREAQEATKVAAQILQNPIQAPKANQPISKPVSAPVHQPVDEPEPVQQVEKPKRPKTDKPAKIMKGFVYREVSQRGGQRWFLAEPEKDYLDRKAEQERERLKRQQARLENGENDSDLADQTPIPNLSTTPPTSPSSTEQKPISTAKETAHDVIVDSPQTVAEEATGTTSLKEGQSLEL